MYAPKLKTASKKSLLSQKSAVLQSSNKRDPLLQQVSRMGNAPNPKAHAAILNRAPVSQQSSNQQLLLLLQRQYGNDYVNRVLAIARANKEETSVTSREKPVIQAKLTIGQAGDKYEQEADRTAHQVIQKMSESETVPAEEDRAQVEEETDSPQIQQKCSGCGQKDDSVQMKPETETLPSEEMSEEEDNENLMVQRQPETETLPSEEMSEEEDNENLMVQSQPETETLPSEEMSEEEDNENLMVQRQPETEALHPEEMSEEEDNENLMVQRKATGGRVEATPDLTSSIQRQRGKGQPLPGQLRQQLEQAFGKDFSGVRIHTDANADALTRSIKARAFTIGQDIFFRQGEYTPGSKQGQELLAHELTHVVQQNGDGVKSKEDAGVKVSEVSEDTEVQRACAQCEQEEKAEGMIQAKEAPGSNPEQEASIEKCNNGSPSADSEVEASGEQASGNQAEASTEGCSGNGSEDNETDESDTEDCKQENSTDGNTDEGQNEGEQNQQCPSEKEEEENGEQSEPNEVSQDRSKLDESAQCNIFFLLTPPTINSQDATTTEQPANSQAPTYNQNFTPDETTNPQATTTEQPTNSQAPTYNQNFTPDEITNPEVVTEQVQANTNTTQTQGQLRTTDAQIARLASAKVNFKLPEQAETQDRDRATLEAQRSTSSSMASNFFADAASRVQKVTGLGQHIAGRINQATETAKAAVLSTVQQQKATVTAQINQKRTQLQNQAQETLAEIQNQHQITIANIAQTTEATVQQIHTEYSNAFDELDEERDGLLEDIDQVYKDTYDDYIKKGEDIGTEAIDIGEEYEQQYLAEAEEEREEQKQLTQEYHEKVSELSQNQNARQNHRQTDTSGPPPKDKSNEIGKDLEKIQDKIIANIDKVLKSDKKAATAIEVAKSYQLQVKNQATEQANQLANGKPEAVEGICCAITKIYKKLEKNQKETINCLKDFQQSSVLEATKVQTELTESVNENLQTTLESLDEQESIQSQILQGYGDRQIGVIEEDAEKAISSLENGVNQAATQLLATLQGYYDEFQGMEAPHPDELRGTLAEILGEIDSSIATVEAETEKGITASAQGIQQGEQQVVGAVNEIAGLAIEEIDTVAEEARTIFVNLTQGIVDAFNSLQDTYAEGVNGFTRSGLTETTDSIGSSFNCIYINLETNLNESIPKLEESLRSILDCLRTDIENYADKAVGDDQEWWQKLLKALVFVAVIVIGIVVAPLFAGLGVVAGIILGAALGALAQIANNAIDGKDLMKDVGDAAIMGAIGGAIGGFGGALGGALGQAGKLGAGLAKSVAQYGIETAFDIVGEVVGNLATGEDITAEGILMGVAVGTAVHVSTTKLHGINKRAQVADTFNKNPDLADQLPKMSPNEINGLAKETGMDPGELNKLAKMDPDKRKDYVEDAKQRNSEYDSWAGQKIKNFAQGFENYQRSGAEFGQRVGSAVTRPIKNAFGGSRSEADVSIFGTRPNADTETPRGLQPDAVSTRKTSETSSSQHSKLEQELTQALPSKFRNRNKVPLKVDSHLTGNTVLVRYDLNTKTGLVDKVRIHAGQDATKTDIKLHVRTVELMQRYSGLSGMIRRLKQRIQTWINKNGEPPVGSRAWEAKLEIDKLPRIIKERLERLGKDGLDKDAEADLKADIKDLEQQLDRHQRTWDEMDADPGVGFVAMDGSRQSDSSQDDQMQTEEPTEKNNKKRNREEDEELPDSKKIKIEDIDSIIKKNIDEILKLSSQATEQYLNQKFENKPRQKGEQPSLKQPVEETFRKFFEKKNSIEIKEDELMLLTRRLRNIEFSDSHPLGNPNFSEKKQNQKGKIIDKTIKFPLEKSINLTIKNPKNRSEFFLENVSTYKKEANNVQKSFSKKEFTDQQLGEMLLMKKTEEIEAAIKAILSGSHKKTKNTKKEEESIKIQARKIKRLSLLIRGIESGRRRSAAPLLRLGLRRIRLGEQTLTDFLQNHPMAPRGVTSKIDKKHDEAREIRKKYSAEVLTKTFEDVSNGKIKEKPEQELVEALKRYLDAKDGDKSKEKEGLKLAFLKLLDDHANPRENTLQEISSDRSPDTDIDTDEYLSNLSDKEGSITTDKDNGEVKVEESVQQGQYEPTQAQIDSLPNDLEIIRISADGDCLFNALIRMDVYPPDRDRVSNAAQFRQFIADRVTDEDSQFITNQNGNQNMDRDTIANTIARPGSYDNEVGDITPLIIARELNVNIIVHDENGTPIPIAGSANNPTIHLVRVTNPLPHYHATQSQNNEDVDNHS